METCNNNLPPVVTPPRWKGLIFWAFLSVVSGQMVNWEAFDISTVICLPFLLISLTGTFASGIHYKFTQVGLLVCFLWIPLRRVGWDRITHALFAHKWEDAKPRYSRIANPGPVTGQIIYVTIDNCPRWNPNISRMRHNISNPFRAFTIWLPYQQKHYLIEMFAKYYPALERQKI